jgi:hypothetical protein
MQLKASNEGHNEGSEVGSGVQAARKRIDNRDKTNARGDLSSHVHFDPTRDWLITSNFPLFLPMYFLPAHFPLSSQCISCQLSKRVRYWLIFANLNYSVPGLMLILLPLPKCGALYVTACTSIHAIPNPFIYRDSLICYNSYILTYFTYKHVQKTPINSIL